MMMTFESVGIGSSLDVADKDAAGVVRRLYDALNILLKGAVFILHCNYYLL
jgi:hypothetical protein